MINKVKNAPKTIKTIKTTTNRAQGNEILGWQLVSFYFQQVL
jgi:hypothetical protein